MNNKNIAPLKNPIGEFNARGGDDVENYLTHVEYLKDEYPNLGRDEWEQLQDNLPSFDTIEDPLTKQRLRVQRFNWPEDNIFVKDQTVTVRNLPFSVPIDLKHLIYQNYLIAEAIDTPFMIIESPGYGESEELSGDQKIALKKGDFGPIAKPMLGIIKSFGIKRINAVGYSMGADIAASIAAHASEFGIEVEGLFAMESPRVEEQSPLKLAKNFTSDANNLKFAWQNPYNPVLSEIAKLGLALPKGLTTYGKALYKGGLKADIAAALSTQPSMKVTLASAGSSKISSSPANTNLATELAIEFPNRSVRRIIVPGESHAYADSGDRYADLTRIVLRESTKPVSSIENEQN